MSKPTICIHTSFQIGLASVLPWVVHIGLWLQSERLCLGYFLTDGILLGEVVAGRRLQMGWGSIFSMARAFGLRIEAPAPPGKWDKASHIGCTEALVQQLPCCVYIQATTPSHVKKEPHAVRGVSRRVHIYSSHFKLYLMLRNTVIADGKQCY